MNRSWKWGGVVLVAILAPGPPAVCGQGGKGYWSVQQAQNAHWHRMRREMAVAYVGPIARGLVETHGEDAVKALAACSPAMGRNLAAFFNSGQLDSQIPRPAALLVAIGSPGAGDVVAWWSMQHAAELNDIDACDAFCREPLSYALHLKTLEAGVAEVRALRLRAASGPPAQDEMERKVRVLAVAASVTALIVLAVWWKRRRREAQMGA